MPPRAAVTAIARDSFHRCLESPTFFTDFYQTLFRAIPASEPMFAQTDFDRQARLLEHAIKILMIFPTNQPTEPTVLTRLAAKHGRAGLDVPPAWFPVFLDCLVATAARCDPQFSPAVEAAWREALEPGIEYLREWSALYGERPDLPTPP